MTGLGAGAVSELVKAVARLALPPDAQVGYLNDLGVLPSIDELALELHDRAVMLPQLVAAGWLTSHDADLIRHLDQVLAQLSDGDAPELWSEKALRESPRWEEVRSRARAVLLA